MNDLSTSGWLAGWRHVCVCVCVCVCSFTAVAKLNRLGNKLCSIQQKNDDDDDDRC